MVGDGSGGLGSRDAFTCAATETPVAADHLYHIVPKELEGDFLYPLNVLARERPAVARAAAEKYVGREHLMDVVIPILDCRWNDVLHLSPLHPGKTKQALVAAGFQARDFRFFVIPPAAIPRGAAVNFMNSKDTGGRYDFDPGDFTPFDPAAYRELEAVPGAQIRYFSEMRRHGERPLLWARTPHVFYRGNLDIRPLEVIAW